MSNEHEALSECNKCGCRYPSAPAGHIHKCGNCPGTCYPLATPSPSADTLERREAIEAAVKSAIGRALRAELDPTLGRSLEYRTAERAKAVDEATDKIAALTTSPRVDEGRTLCREGIVAFSADIENPRVLKLHFDQDVTSAHRALILEAINARRAALATTPADPRADEEPWAWGWYERGGTKRAYPYLPTVDYTTRGSTTAPVRPDMTGDCRRHPLVPCWACRARRAGGRRTPLAHRLRSGTQFTPPQQPIGIAWCNSAPVYTATPQKCAVRSCFGSRMGAGESFRDYSGTLSPSFCQCSPRDAANDISACARSCP